MFCTQCGVQIGEVNYCPHCGAATARAPQVAEKRLYRSRTERKIAGVCGGLAKYVNLDPTIVRLAWLVLTLLPPCPGLLAYLLAWVVVPLEPPELETTSASPALAPR